MLGQYHNMFAPVSEFIEGQTAILTPPTSHPLLQEKWHTAIHDAATALHKELDIPEEDWHKFEKVQSLFLCGLKLFNEKARNQPWTRRPVEQKQDHIRELLARPSLPQRTQAWYEQAYSMLTASEFAELYGSERGYANLVLSKAMPPPLREGPSKLACPTSDMSPFDWGIRFEPVVKQAFSKFWSLEIVESGRIIHPTVDHLAASPDGLILEAADKERVGRLMEIKCPIRREIDGTVPFEYWCQMQIQMEVMDIDECEFLDVKFVSPEKQKSAYVKPETTVMEGQLWLMNKEEAMLYTYAYTEEERDAAITDGWAVFETIPWAISKYSMKVVQRDRTWFQDTEAARDAFWADVQKAKDGTFKLPPPMPPRKKACQIVDSPPETTSPL
jgi:hypothetical protein